MHKEQKGYKESTNRTKKNAWRERDYQSKPDDNDLEGEQKRGMMEEIIMQLCIHFWTTNCYR